MVIVKNGLIARSELRSSLTCEVLMADFQYTEDQINGWKLFSRFYMEPLENVMLLKGYSGTGKSTLVRMIIERIPKLDEMRRLVDSRWKGYQILLTATTNQAALSLSQASSMDATTIHNALSLRVQVVDYKTRETRLVSYGDEIRDCLVFIDEASYINQELLGWIFKKSINCKFVFIGDHCQLTPVGSHFMPAFEMNKNQIELTQLVRFDDGPITRMVGNLRDTVLTGNWHKFELASGIIERVDRSTFEDMAYETFSNERDYGTAKILGYRNDTTIGYNSRIAQRIMGTSELQEGQRVICNSAVSHNSARISANYEVMITSIKPDTELGYKGHRIELLGKSGDWFMPLHREYKGLAHKDAVLNEDYEAMKLVSDSWIDLRPAFSCTVNKAQGSTYDTVFVDIGDIRKGAFTANQMARLLYVGNSRCRSRCIMTEG